MQRFGRMSVWVGMVGAGLLLLAGCGGSNTTNEPTALLAQDPEASSQQVLMETSLGDITLSLDAEKAPLTVENFLFYANQGHYEGMIFHRVIEGFMIQGGGFTEEFSQKPTVAPVPNEADNGLKNDRYTIAMARTADPQSAKAQFFINVEDNSYLNYTAPTPTGWGYAVFGRVIDGFEIVDQIAESATSAAGPFKSDVPLQPIVIQSMQIQ